MSQVTNIVTAVLTSAPFWGAAGGVGGATIGYYQGTSKDAATLVIELTKSANSVDEKAKVIDLLISRGLLSGVTAVKIGEILERNAEQDASSVPDGLVCQAIWCGLRGQVTNIKKFYTKLNIYNGTIDDKIDDNFSNATVKYQMMKSIEVDGIVGAKTFRHIIEDARPLSLSF